MAGKPEASVSVRVDAIVYAEMRGIAAEEGISITDLVSACFKAYVRERMAANAGVVRIEERLVAIEQKLNLFLEVE